MEAIAIEGKNLDAGALFLVGVKIIGKLHSSLGVAAVPVDDLVERGFPKPRTASVVIDAVFVRDQQGSRQDQRRQNRRRYPRLLGGCRAFGVVLLFFRCGE